jgi:hypothetical protein
MKHRRTRARKASRKQKRHTRRRSHRGGANMKVSNLTAAHFPMMLIEDGDGYKYHSAIKSADGLTYTGYICNYPGSASQDTIQTSKILTYQPAQNKEQVEQFCS